ncbi:MAG: protein-disulfide reductase DsbD family protein [Acidobacteria bacterium]|nr:protein-disulfide reductase DsbD family protein [Acidobacteriota bacterium]
MNTSSLRGIAVFLMTFGPGLAQTADQVVQWTAKPTVSRPGQTFNAELSMAIEKGWHVYALAQQPPPKSTTIEPKPGQPVRLNGSITGSKPVTAYDPNFEMNTATYEGAAQFSVPLTVEPNAPGGEQTIVFDVRFQTCNDRICLPPKKRPVEMKLTIEGGSTAAPVHQPSQPRQSFGAFLWLAFVMGALSLLTPCVFPMIPITVSYFTSHSAKQRGAAIRSALVYAAGIILTFTALGMALALVFGASGVNQLAANPWVNLVITAIFVSFAFGLFGAFLMQVPPSLVQKIDSLSRNPGTSDNLGVLLMGLTFTLTSFTCTAPFVGTLLVMAAQGNWKWPMAGMLVFSSVFALPFFVLALLPQLLSQLPKSGGWLNSVKVVMGFLEIAAAMKFLSNVDLIWRWNIFTREVVLAVWVAIGILIVVYLLGKFQMTHDSPVKSVGAARLTFALVFLTITVWLTTGLFGRPLGEIESFLPPAVEGNASSASSATGAGLAWVLNDYAGALKQAQAENKPLFIDFTGYTCTNCRWMEVNMFPRAEVRRELEKFVRVRLYTDGSGELFERQQQFQNDRFATVALPFYAVVRPDGQTVATFPGLTRKPEEFAGFLAGAAGRM